MIKDDRLRAEVGSKPHLLSPAPPSGAGAADSILELQQWGPPAEANPSRMLCLSRVVLHDTLHESCPAPCTAIYAKIDRQQMTVQVELLD